jgi:hypothetical protein
MRKRYYPEHPPKALIRFVIGISGMKVYDLERFFGMPDGTISNHLSKYNRDIPRKYWRLFYDPPISLKIKTRQIVEAMGLKFDKKVDVEKHVEEAVVEENKKSEIRKIGVLADLLKD